MSQIDLNDLYCDDIRNLKNYSVDPEHGLFDVIITSPPYADTINYGSDNQIGYGESRSQYSDSMREVFEQCARLSKPHASMWMVVDSVRRGGRLDPLPFSLAQVAEPHWKLVDVIIWDKGKTRPWSRRGQLRNRFEYILFFVKDHKNYTWNVDELRDVKLTRWWKDYPHRYSPLGKVPSNIWNLMIPIQGSWSRREFAHFCPFPPELVQRFIQLSTSRSSSTTSRPVVFDPFAGSGTVLAVAECMGCDYVGFEINPKFCEQFQAVRSDVAQQWKALALAQQERSGIQRVLSDLIPKLRETRYARQVFVELCQDIERRQPSGHVVHSLTNSRFHGLIINTRDRWTPEAEPYTPSTRLATMELTLVLSDLPDEARGHISDYLRELSKRKPLSKFGLSVTFTIATLNSHGPLEQHWVYENGKTWDAVSPFRTWSNAQTFTEGLPPSTQWWMASNRHYPPIIADVCVTSEDCNQIPVSTSLYDSSDDEEPND